MKCIPRIQGGSTDSLYIHAFCHMNISKKKVPMLISTEA